MKKVVTTKKNSKKIPAAKKVGRKEWLERPLTGAFIVGILAFIALYPSLSNDFVNWDDPSYVLNNMRIRNFDFGVLVEMFNPFPKNYLVSNYHPLTELSLAFDHMFFGGLDAWGYHFTNLAMHTANSVLVFLLVNRLTDGKIMAAVLAGVLFGIHPMHVESVAWVSERKDVLHVFFFLLALLQYHKYLTRGNAPKYLGLTLLFFICSLLSKAQAVTLPIVLVLMDYFYRRKDLVSIAVEKAPFFVLSLLFGLLAIKAQSSTEAITLVDIPLWQRPFTGSYALFTYLWMMVVPVGLSALHPYPFEMGSDLPATIYASIVVMLAFWGLVFYAWKKEWKVTVFGLTFFFFTIAPVLQFLTVGEAIIAERYTYLPYVGLFFMLGFYFDKLISENKFKQYSIPVLGLVTVACIGYTLMTWNRISYWKDSPTLWNNVVDQYPNTKLAYVNLSHFFSEVKEYDKCIEYAEKGLEFAPNHYKLWVNKAFAMMKKGQHQQAIPVLMEAVKRDPDHYEIYYNLGICYDNLKQFDKSFQQYNKTLEYEPEHIQAFLQRGVIYSNHKNDQEKAVADFKKVVEYAPTHPDGLMNLAVSHYKLKKYTETLDYATRATEATPQNGKAFYVKALAHEALGQFPAAATAGRKAIGLGNPVPDAKIKAWESR